METHKEIDMNAQNLLTVNLKAVKKAYKAAVKDALKKHQLAKNPVATWQGGKVVVGLPDEISKNK